MDRYELKAALLKRGIRNGSFSIGGLNPHDESLVLERTEEGWQVYYFERGLKNGVARFENEAEACEHFFAELSADETAYLRPAPSRAPWWKFW